MAARMPFAIEMVFLMLVLPIALVYLFSVAGVVTLCARTAFKRLFSPFPGPSGDLSPRTADTIREFFPTALGIRPSQGTRGGS